MFRDHGPGTYSYLAAEKPPNRPRPRAVAVTRNDGVWEQDAFKVRRDP